MRVRKKLEGRGDHAHKGGGDFKGKLVIYVDVLFFRGGIKDFKGSGIGCRIRGRGANVSPPPFSMYASVQIPWGV